MDRARKKTEKISDNTDMTEKEKNLSMKAVYKRAGLLTKKKPETKYVVSTKGKRGKQTKFKGPVKLVDKRMRKDKSFNRPGSLAQKKMGKARQTMTKNTKKNRSKKH